VLSNSSYDQKNKIEQNNAWNTNVGWLISVEFCTLFVQSSLVIRWIKEHSNTVWRGEKVKYENVHVDLYNCK